MKKIIAVSMVKNEQDIIESFVRHTLSFADGLLICDHMSSDKTPEILQKLVEEGMPLTIYAETNPAYFQSEVTTRLLREALAQGADFVLPLDADEFLLVDEAEGRVRECLLSLDADKVYHLPWRMYAPRGADDRVFLLSRPLWRAQNWQDGGKIIVGRLAYREGDIVVQGNHNLLRTSAQGVAHLPKSELGGLYIAHFYWRSHEQFSSKIVVGWANIAARFSRFSFSGGSYAAMYARLKRGEEIPLEEIMPRAEPIAPLISASAVKLRYTETLNPHHAFYNLMAAAERLAQTLAEGVVLTQKVTVDTVLIYNGDKKLFTSSLSAALDQDYPWQEFHVCALDRAEPPSEALDALTEHGIRWLNGENPFADLGLKGKYAQFILSGEIVWPQKLREMVTAAERQELKFAVLSGQSAGEISPGETLTLFYLTNAWRKILPQGRAPASALATLLFNLEQFNNFAWLNSCFMDGQPLLLTMWRHALLESADRDRKIIAFMPGAYAQSAPTSPLNLLYRQTERELILTDDKILSEEERETARSFFASEGLRGAAT